MAPEPNAESTNALPEPVDTGTQSTSTQRRAEVSEIISAAAPPAGQTGIRESTAEAFVSALRYGSIQVQNLMQIWARGVDHDKERAEDRLDKAKEQVLQQTVMNARLDERLKLNQHQSGSQLFAASVGGVFLGYGMGKLEAQIWGHGIFVSLLGLVLMLYGCWPTISLRWWKNGR